jgi:hypothetical protein
MMIIAMWRSMDMHFTSFPFSWAGEGSFGKWKVGGPIYATAAKKIF